MATFSSETLAVGLAHAIPLQKRISLYEDPQDLADDVARTDPATVTVVALPGELRRVGLARLKSIMLKADGTQLAWGLLTGFDLRHVSWVILKNRLLNDMPSGPTVLIRPGGPKQSQSINQTVKSLPLQWHDVVAIESHGDQADVFLGAGYLCSRVEQDYTGLIHATGGMKLPRCFFESHCYRLQSTTDEKPLPQGTLIPADSVRAKLMLLNSCAAAHVAGTALYDLNASVVLQATRGYTAAVLASDTARVPYPAESERAAALARDGACFGAVVTSLNRDSGGASQTPVAGFLLLGDPAASICSAASYSPKQVVPLQPGSAPSALRLPSGRIVSRGAAPSSGNASLHERRTEANVSLVSRLIQLQRNINVFGEIRTVSIPDLEHIREQIAMVRAAALGPFTGTDVPIPLYRHVAALDLEIEKAERLALSQLSQAWSDANRGEIVSFDEDHLIFGPPLPAGTPCGHCGEETTSIPTQNAWIPDFDRIWILCSNCNFVGDFDADGPQFWIEGPSSIAAGSTLSATVSVEAADSGSTLLVVGAAFLGARGRAGPRTLALTTQPGVASRTTFSVRTDAAFVPGVYYLKVGVMVDLRFSYRLKPVSVLPATLPRGARNEPL